MASGTFRRQRRSRVWVIVLVALIGLELGGLLGIYLAQWEQLGWVAKALEIGTENPWILKTPLHDANILFRTRFNAGSLIGLTLALALYSLFRRR